MNVANSVTYLSQDFILEDGLNQIARALNEYGTPYNALSVEVRAAISDLAALKFEVLRKVGDAVGNIQTYQL